MGQDLGQLSPRAQDFVDRAAQLIQLSAQLRLNLATLTFG